MQEATTIHPNARISGIVLTFDDALRFWAKVRMGGPKDCWPWTGSKHRLGYGNFRVGGKIIEAHRVAKALVDGEFEGQVLHDCDNRECCNPEHTFVGSHADNMADCAAKGRNRSPRPGNGYEKIDDAASIEIFEKAEAGANYSQLAREYGVTPPTIRAHHRKHEEMKGIAGAIAKGYAKWERKPHDFYATPYEGTESLIPLIEKIREHLGRPPEKFKVWEPCSGDLDMTRVLEWHGYEVTSTELRDTGQGVTGVDFLNDDPAEKWGWIVDADMIVMNPPFSLAAEFIERALSYTPNVACLVKIDYWNAISRLPLFEKKRPHFFLPLTFRLAFLKAERGNSPLMNCAWVVWTDDSMKEDLQSIGVDGTLFEPLRKRVYPGYRGNGVRKSLAVLGQAMDDLAAAMRK